MKTKLILMSLAFLSISATADTILQGTEAKKLFDTISNVAGTQGGCPPSIPGRQFCYRKLGALECLIHIAPIQEDSDYTCTLNNNTTNPSCGGSQ